MDTKLLSQLIGFTEGRIDYAITLCEIYKRKESLAVFDELIRTLKETKHIIAHTYDNPNDQWIYEQLGI